MKKKNNDNQEIMWALRLFTQLGISMAACVFVGVMGGRFLDQWLGTSPWLLVLGALLGAASSFKVMYDLVIKEWFK